MIHLKQNNQKKIKFIVMKAFEFFILSIFVLFLGVITYVKDIFPEGNKDLRKESRDATGFDQIASSGDFKVIVKQGNTYSVEVKAESNLLPYIETEVVDQTLRIKTLGIRILLHSCPIEIFITTPVLNGLLLSGSGMIKTGSFVSDQFRILLSGSGDIDTKINTGLMKAYVSGSGNIFLEGDAKASRLVISGSGRIKSYQSTQRNCEAIIIGSGNMYVNTLETIDARITGSGKVLYISHPIINKSVYGSGDVFDMNQSKGELTDLSLHR